MEADALPDVVLEVDHSTDVRRGKLGIYKESGFPEVWVLVPWEESVRAPGLAIHVRRGGRYREEVESRAFPGWKREEIFGALTEDPWTAGTIRALERVARAMGAREGTRPEDHPVTRLVSLEAEARGETKGYERGRGEERAANLRAVLAARGIEAALDSAEDRALIGALPVETLMAAALACTGEADFRRRIRERLGPPSGSLALRLAAGDLPHGTGRGRGGARVHRRGRLPPRTGPRAARPAHRALALTRSGRPPGSGRSGPGTGEGRRPRRQAIATTQWPGLEPDASA